MKEDVIKRCEIHAEKMDLEGHYTTANTLQLAADRIRELETGLATVRKHLRVFALGIGIDVETLRSAEEGETH